MVVFFSKQFDFLVFYWVSQLKKWHLDQKYLHTHISRPSWSVMWVWLWILKDQSLGVFSDLRHHLMQL